MRKKNRDRIILMIVVTTMIMSMLFSTAVVSVSAAEATNIVITDMIEWSRTLDETVVDSEFAYEITVTPNMNYLQADKTLDVAVSVTNMSGKSVPALAIVALYDESDRMKNLSYISKLIALDATEKLNAGFRLPEDVTDHIVRVFVWDGQTIDDTTMQPLSEVFELDTIPEKPISHEIPPEGFDIAMNGVDYGSIEEIQYYSKTTGRTRKANVILPAGYNESKKYPVLYLLHGIGGDHREWLSGNPQYIIGNLIASGKVEDMIVVIPNCRARADDSVPMADMYSLAHFQAFDNFINDLKDDLMPYIKANYSIAEGRDKTAIAGLSMGGRTSLYIGFKMPETFGYVGAFTPAFGLLEYTNFGVTEEGLFTEDTFKLPEAYNGNTLVMISAGLSDTIVRDEPKRYHLALEKNGVKHYYYELAGGHDFTVWKDGLYNFAKELFH